MGAVQSSVDSEVLIAGAAVAVGSLTTIGLYVRNAKKQQQQDLLLTVDQKSRIRLWSSWRRSRLTPQLQMT